MGVILVGGLGIAYVRTNERRRRTLRTRTHPIDTTPYTTGAALGLLIAVSLVGFGQIVGASGGIQNLAAVIGHWLTPGVAYWGHVVPIGVSWPLLVVAGIVLGAYVGAEASGRWRVSFIPARGWTERFGPSRVRRWAIAFVAAVVIEYASAIAGGCTSGLALSGGIVLAPGAFLFMGAMFATGIPTAWLVGRAGRRGGDA